MDPKIVKLEAGQIGIHLRNVPMKRPPPEVEKVFRALLNDMTPPMLIWLLTAIGDELKKHGVEVGRQ